MVEQLYLRVFFEDSFWVGVFERSGGGQLQVCRVVFGAEPRDAEIYEFILKQFCRLRFSPAVAQQVKLEAANPKRRQRQAQRAVSANGIGTKSQQALQALREQQKTERRAVTRAERQAEAERRYAQKQQKRREKHKGH